MLEILQCSYALAALIETLKLLIYKTYQPEIYCSENAWAAVLDKTPKADYVYQNVNIRNV